jgi:hypothetical protein
VPPWRNRGIGISELTKYQFGLPWLGFQYVKATIANQFAAELEDDSDLMPRSGHARLGHRETFDLGLNFSS